MRYLKMLVIILLVITGCSKTEIVDDVSFEPIPSTKSKVEIKNKHNNIDDNLLELENNNQNTEVKKEVEIKDEEETLRFSTKENPPIKIEDKSVEPKKNKTTYGDVRYIDETIPYKTLDDKLEPNKEKGSSGVVTKGKNGIKRKEVRDVYINDKFSHTETVKDAYTVTEPVNAQNWIGTKETKPSKPSGPQDVRTDYSKTHPNDFTNHIGSTLYYYATFYNFDEAVAQGWNPADKYNFDGYTILQEDVDKWYFYIFHE